MSSTPDVDVAHKRNFRRFIEPNYERVNVNPGEVRDQFQAFLDTCLDAIPNDGSPADGYMYNAHMGSFVRHLDIAKDEYVKARMAFLTTRGSSKKARE